MSNPEVFFYRICKAEYAENLKASGVPNRWNLKNEFVIYVGSTRSLSSLESLVHRGLITPSMTYKVMVISIKNFEENKTTLEPSSLPESWNSFEKLGQTQKLGSEWYTKNKSLTLSVPSAIITQENNIVINTNHPSFGEDVKIETLESYFWDKRLL